MTVQMLYQKQNEYRPWKRKVYLIQSQFQNAEDLFLRLRFSVSFSYIKQTFHEKKEKKKKSISLTKQRMEKGSQPATAYTLVALFNL